MKSPIRLMAVAAVIALFSAVAVLAQHAGQDSYKAKCVMCHAADGTGNTPAGKATKSPSFQAPEMLKMSDAEFIADTRSGKGKMPAYAGKLTDSQIKDVIAYIRTLQNK